MRIRVGLWLALGSAMGIPVDALFQAINADLDAARKLLGRKRPRLSTEQRLSRATLAQKLCGPLRELIRWIVTPENCIRWLKRYQERQANGGTTPPAKKSCRPWIKPEDGKPTKTFRPWSEFGNHSPIPMLAWQLGYGL